MLPNQFRKTGINWTLLIRRNSSMFPLFLQSDVTRTHTLAIWSSSAIEVKQVCFPILQSIFICWWKHDKIWENGAIIYSNENCNKLPTRETSNVRIGLWTSQNQSFICPKLSPTIHLCGKSKFSVICILSAKLKLVLLWTRLGFTSLHRVQEGMLYFLA